VVTDPNDPRLNDFTALNDPATRRRVERAGDYFVVEGRLAIERLVQLPRWSIRRLVLLPRTYRQLEAWLPSGTEVLITEEGVLRSVVGFDLHRGALASVDRKPKVPLSSPPRPSPLALPAPRSRWRLASIPSTSPPP